MNYLPLTEAALYHDTAARGYVALFVGGRQHCCPLSHLSTALDALPQAGDVYLSQASFHIRSRCLVHLARLGLCFADLETHRTPYADHTPEQQARALLLHCDDEGIPRPSLINHSGRGLHVKWIFDTPLPGIALPRWNAVERRLTDHLTPFGLDRAARDGSRCLRLVGSVNSRSGLPVHTVWADERGGNVTRWDFDTLADEVLPLSRADWQAHRQKAQNKQVASPDAPHRPCNLWQPRQLWWYRLADVRTLVALRGWHNGVPEGYRNNFLYVAACAAAWGANPADLDAEVSALAQELCPSLSPSAVRSTTSTVLARAGSPYKFTNLRLIELLDVQPDEQPHLKTILDPDERKRRDRLRHRKHTDRADYEANAQARRQQAHALHSSGLTYRQIAAQMNTTINAVDKLLRSKSVNSS